MVSSLRSVRLGKIGGTGRLKIGRLAVSSPMVTASTGRFRKESIKRTRAMRLSHFRHLRRSFSIFRRGCQTWFIFACFVLWPISSSSSSLRRFEDELWKDWRLEHGVVCSVDGERTGYSAFQDSCEESEYDPFSLSTNASDDTIWCASAWVVFGPGPSDTPRATALWTTDTLLASADCNDLPWNAPKCPSLFSEDRHLAVLLFKDPKSVVDPELIRNYHQMNLSTTEHRFNVQQIGLLDARRGFVRLGLPIVTGRYGLHIPSAYRECPLALS